MSNPPGWVYNSRLTTPYGEVNVMPSIQAGVVSMADTASQPTQGTGSGTPSTWAWVWFGVATLYLFGVYSGHVRVARER